MTTLSPDPGIAATAIRITLPLPPSKNALHVPAIHHEKGTPRTFSTTEARAWYQQVVGTRNRMGELTAQVLAHKTEWAWAYAPWAQLNVSYVVYKPRWNHSDCHNHEEALFDALEKSGLINNDCAIYKHSGERGEWTGGEPRVEVTLTPIEGGTR